MYKQTMGRTYLAIWILLFTLSPYVIDPRRTGLARDVTIAGNLFPYPTAHEEVTYTK